MKASNHPISSPDMEDHAVWGEGDRAVPFAFLPFSFVLYLIVVLKMNIFLNLVTDILEWPSHWCPCLKNVPGILVLFKYSPCNRTEDNCHWRDGLFLTVSKRRGAHHPKQSHRRESGDWSRAEGEWARANRKPSWCFPEKVWARQSKGTDQESIDYVK